MGYGSKGTAFFSVLWYFLFGIFACLILFALTFLTSHSIAAIIRPVIIPATICFIIGYASSYIFGNKKEKIEEIKTANIDLNNDNKIDELRIGNYRIQGFVMVAYEVRIKGKKKLLSEVEYTDLNKAIYFTVGNIKDNRGIANFMSLDDAKEFINHKLNLV